MKTRGGGFQISNLSIVLFRSIPKSFRWKTWLRKKKSLIFHFSLYISVIIYGKRDCQTLGGIAPKIKNFRISNIFFTISTKMYTYPEIFTWLAFLVEELKFRTRILRTHARTHGRTHRQLEVSIIRFYILWVFHVLTWLYKWIFLYE